MQIQKFSQATNVSYQLPKVRAGVQDTPDAPSELDTLIGPEPPLPGPTAYRNLLAGVALGAAGGALIGLGGRELYASGMSIPSASYVHFGGLMGSVGAGAVLGQGLSPAFDAPTRGVLGGIGTMTFALVTSTLGVAQGVGAAAVGGAVMGGVFGLTRGLLQEQSQNSAA